MPPLQRGQVYRLQGGGWGLRYYVNGKRRRAKGLSWRTKSAALAYYRDTVEPRLRGEAPELTLAELVEQYLDRHTAVRRSRTITTLRERLAYATRAYGEVPLHELEKMSPELADWQALLPARSRYGIMQALRQTLTAAQRWGYISSNPAKLAGPNPEPPPRGVRAFSLAELEAIAAALPPRYRPLPSFAAATGLRPEEWMGLERRDLDRAAGVLTLNRTVSDGELVELGKTNRSRRQVPLSRRALAALDQLPARLDTPLLFAAPEGGLLNLDNFRRREWGPAVTASGVAQPARIYDLRATFASNALAGGVTVFALARLMGTSVRMIERHYGTLLDGAQAELAGRLDAIEAKLEHAVEAEAGES